MEDLSTKVVEIIDCEGASNICEEVASSSQANNGSQDFSCICRICALKTHNTMPLFEGEGAEQKLMEKINKYLPVQISHNDGLPSVICYQCSSALLTWHELVECCVQADASFRKQLSLAGSLSVNMSSSSKCDVDNLDEDTLKYKRSVMFLTVVVNALTEYFKSNQLDIETDWEYVCQKCDDKPTSKNVQCLSEHLKMKHGNELFNRQTVAQFIENYITFEEALLSDDEVQGPDNKEQKKKKKSPRDVVCFFCEYTFTSTRRLMFHLNKHLDMPKNGGILCCGNIYDDLKLFEIHISEKHSIQKIVGHICKTCGFAAPDEMMLKKHIKREHSASEPRPEFKEKKKFGPKNQKNFPAVCPECNKTFSNKYNMSHHMRLHRAPKFDCPKCDKSYRAKSSLVHHMEVVHEGKLRFPCPACGEAFPTRLARDVHARLHSGATPFECQYCGKAFRARNTLHNHLKAHRDVRAHACPLCPHRLKKIDDGNKTHFTKPDFNEQKSELKRCQYCNSNNHAYFEIFYSKCPKDNLLRICLTCGRGNPLRDNIDVILQPYWARLPNNFIPTSVSVSSSTITVSNTESHTVTCDSELTAYRFPPSYAHSTNTLTDSESHENVNIKTCNKLELSSPTAGKLNEAPSNDAIELLCNTSRDNTSEKCENDFSDHSDIESFAQLPKSVFEAIEDTQDTVDDLEKSPKKERKKRKSHTCPICGKVYTASSSYFYHKKHFHEQVKNYSCDVCEKKFGTRGDLVQHSTVHTGERKYECSECDKRFRSKASLYIHEQTHRDVKSHKCTKCGRSFRWVAHLQRHMLRHGAAKAHECGACGRGFTVRCDLLRHARTHTAGSYECDQCQVKFAQMRYLRAHMIKKHGNVRN